MLGRDLPTSAFKVTGPPCIYSDWQLGTLLPMAHTALAAAFVLNHTKIGKCTLKKFRIYSQWHGELFLFVIFLLSIGGAMNAPRLWNLRKEHLAGVRIFFVPC